MKRVFGLTIAAVSLTGCAKTFIEKSKNWDPKDETPALMVHYSIIDHFDRGKKESWGEIVKSAVQAYQGKTSDMDKSAKKSLTRLKPLFARYNLSLYFDQDAAKKTENIKGVWKQARDHKGDGDRVTKGGVISDGDWLHPDTVEEPFHMSSLPFGMSEKYYQKIAEKTLNGDKNKVAVSMGMEFVQDRSWWLGWVCEAEFRARVIDSSGKEVLVVGGTGESSTRFFRGKDRYLVDACPEAAEDALRKLAKLKVETL